MTATDRHPAAAALAAFAVGALDDAAFAAVETHLAACAGCRDHVGATPADDLVALLAAAGPRLAADVATDSPTQTWAEPAPPVLVPPAALADHPHYRLLRPLGAGGMGTVWLAEHTVMNRVVAVKAIRPEHLARPGAVERFRREAQTLARLAHPNVVAAFDAGAAGDTHYLVMEYVEGESLAAAGRLPVIAACRAVRDAARGLAAAHAAGLVHRDVKPANLIRTAAGRVKVIDFGLAVTADADGLTGPEVVMGTPDYIAPEQAEDARAADARSDIYSLGCTLYALLAGRVPYPVAGTLRKLDAHRAGRPPALADVPPGLAAIVARMMARRPADRFADMAAVAAALDPYCDGTPPVVRRRWRVAAALSAVVLAAGVVVRVQTDRGELTVESLADDVEVVVKQGGKEVAVVDTTTNHRLTLRSGVYELELNGKPSGLALDIDKATLTRGGRVVARVQRAAAPESAAGVRVTEVFRRPAGLDGGPVKWLALAPDGNRLLVVTDKPGVGWTGAVYDVAAGTRLFETTAAGIGEFLPGGREIVGQVGHRRLGIVDAATGAVVRPFDEQPSQLWSLNVAPDGRTCLTGAADGVSRLWDVATGKLIDSRPSTWTYYTPDGKTLLRGPSLDRPTETYDIAARQPGPVPAAYAHAAGMWEESCKVGGGLNVGWLGRTLHVTDRATGATLRSFDLGPSGDRTRPQNVALDPRGRYFVQPLPGGETAVRSLADGATLARLKTATAAWMPTTSADGRRVAAGGLDGEVVVWDLTLP